MGENIKTSITASIVRHTDTDVPLLLWMPLLLIGILELLFSSFPTSIHPCVQKKMRRLVWCDFCWSPFNRFLTWYLIFRWTLFPSLSVCSEVGINQLIPTSPVTTTSKDYTMVTARVGSAASIPCNMTTTSIPEDFVTLVLFYKDDIGGAPIFTIDARSRSLGSAPHVPNGLLAGRVTFDMSNQPAVLRIQPVNKEDDGLYKCRVDYRRGRTMYTTTYLSVISE